MTLLRYLQFLQIGLFTVLQIGEGRGFLLDRSQEKQSHKDIVKTPGANGSEQYDTRKSYFLQRWS